MKVLFIYYDVNSSEPARYACGIGAISAYIKKHGHETHLCYFKSESDNKVLQAKIERFKPDVIGISATTSGFSSVNNVTKFIKEISPKTLVVLGGSHTSICPEDISKVNNVHGVCVGYGEKPFLLLLEALEKGEDYTKTPNFWFMSEDKEVIKNPKLPFPKDWNEFFDFDRELFFNELERLNPSPYNFGRGMLGNKVFEYIFCRACPFACSFCAAPLIKTWGEGSGWLNFPSPEFVIKKLKEDVEKYNLTGFAFHDDVLTFNRKWFMEWAKLYKEEIRLPYACNVRVGTFEGQITEALVESNCKMVITGIESGNDYIRYQVANRKIRKQKIIDSMLALKNAGISLNINNMIGFPEETFDQFMDTLNLNAVIGPSRSNASIFYPYPGTELYNVCIEKKLIDPPDKQGEIKERTQTVLEFANFPIKKIERISAVFFPLVLYQRLVLKWFGENSILSVKYTEPIISRICNPLLQFYFMVKKIKAIIKTPLQPTINHGESAVKSFGFWAYNLNPIVIYRRYKNTLDRSNYY